jgi:hypothetical protein
MAQQTPTFRFDPPTPFVKQILIGATVLYILQQILMQWMQLPLGEWLAWSPNTTFTKPWAVVTHYAFLFNSPIGFLFEMVAIYFFLPVIVQSYGKKGLYRLLIWISVVTTVFGLLGVVSGAIPSNSAPAFGLHPLITAMVVVFGLKNPFATIYLLFFPIQASWIAWGSGILALLNFFAGRSLESLIVLGGWVTGYLFVTGRGNIKPQKLWANLKHERRRRRLQSFDGNKGKPDLFEH